MQFSARNQVFQVEWYGRERMMVMSPTGSSSGIASGVLYAQVLRWARQQRMGKTYPSDVGFRLADGSILSPDVAWLSPRQLAALDDEDLRGFPPGLP
jgi:Uma2 family endonuclease